MGISVDVDAREVHWLMGDLIDASEDIIDRVADVMVASGPTFVRTAKQIVPKDTRALERSIHFTVAKRIPRMRIGPIKRIKNPKSGQLVQTYAGYVHDGTSQMPGRPYIWDAVKRHTTPQGNFMRGLRKAGVGNIGGSSGGVGGAFRQRTSASRAQRGARG